MLRKSLPFITRTLTSRRHIGPDNLRLTHQMEGRPNQLPWAYPKPLI